MKLGSWLWLLRRDVLSQKPRLFLLILCITVTATLFGITASAVAYLRGELRPRLRELFPERRVIVRPAANELLMMRFEGPKIDEATVAHFRSLAEVERVHPQMAAAFPVSAAFDMATVGMGFETDIILFGVPQELVEKDLAIPGMAFDASTLKEPRIPALISEYFLDAYNLGFAESAGMPKLSRRAFLGVEFEILLGESTIGLMETNAAPREVGARVSGLTGNPFLFGICIPLEVMQEFNRQYAPESADKYAILHIDMRSPEDLEALRKEAEARQLAFTAQKEVLDKYLKVVSTLEAVLLAYLATVIALAGVGVFTTTAASIRERRAAWGLHRATGMPPIGVATLAMGHALAAAIPSGVAASAIAWGISRAVQNVLARYAELTFVPADPIGFSAVTLLLIFGFAILFAGIPAMLFAWPIARTRPVKLLAERSL